MTDASKAKAKFRATSKWKNFRARLKSERKKDEITGKPLYKGFQVHHLDLNPSESHYTDLTDPTHFMVLNKMSHEHLHWLYTYWKDDPEILDRLKDALERMGELNG